MKCVKCGSEVKPNYKFCTKCGQPMTEIKSVESNVTKPERELNTNGEEKLFGINFGRTDEKEPKPQKPRNNNHSSNSSADESPALVSNATANIDIVRGKATETLCIHILKDQIHALTTSMNSLVKSADSFAIAGNDYRYIYKKQMSKLLTEISLLDAKLNLNKVDKDD
mgnify:CR=1 FL=1